jgi:hypothetical protein
MENKRLWNLCFGLESVLNCNLFKLHKNILVLFDVVFVSQGCFGIFKSTQQIIQDQKFGQNAPVIEYYQEHIIQSNVL